MNTKKYESNIWLCDWGGGGLHNMYYCTFVIYNINEFQNNCRTKKNSDAEYDSNQGTYHVFRS